MSKNAMWLTIIFAAAIFGAFLGPSLGSLLGETTMLILAPLLLIGVIVFCIWALSNNKSGKKGSGRFERTKPSTEDKKYNEKDTEERKPGEKRDRYSGAPDFR